MSEDALIERLEAVLARVKATRDDRRLQATPIEGFLVPEEEAERPAPDAESTKEPASD